MLNCKVGSLPMTYLGLPISDRNLGVQAFEGVLTKMRKKLQPWKGKNLSSRGRLTLTNSSQSSHPIYMMGMFQLYETNLHDGDFSSCPIYMRRIRWFGS